MRHSSRRPTTRRLVHRRAVGRFGNRVIAATGDGALVARLYVGGKVGRQEVWTLKQVAGVVMRQKHRDGLFGAGTFVASQGIYQGSDDQAPTHESSTIVILSNAYDKLPRAKFKAHVERVAAALRSGLQQEEILVTVTRNALVWRERQTR
jgi:hypothetical protein